jgi:8-oxo-dGTP diphosphatase
MLKTTENKYEGIIIDFESIMNIGHFRNGQFGESNLYLVCTAKALSKDIRIKDTTEVLEARWMDVQDFIHSEDVNNYNKSVVKAALGNTRLKLTEQPVILRISGGEVFY